VEKKIHRTRLILVFLFFATLQTALLFRLIYLQCAKSFSLTKIAISQHKVLIDLEPMRGTIYDRNMFKLAVNHNLDSVFAVPRDIEDKDKKGTARKLAAALDMDENFVFRRLLRKKGFVWIKRKISEQESEKIKALKLKGVELVRESKRFYPNGHLAAHIIGFAGLDNRGLEGIEMVYDKYLRGRPGFRLTARDGKGRNLPAGDEKMIVPVNGFNVILNIDEAIQNFAEQALEEAYYKYHAAGATIVVMDPRTGEILALANRPTYDLNSFFQAGGALRRNRAVTDFFEPGSVFKIVTASGVLEKGIVDFQDRFFCENGKFWIAGHTLHDHTSHGMLTFREVIEQSSNIGTVKVAMKLTRDDLYHYVRGFGFGQLTGVDLPGEVEGITHPPSQWSKTTISALPIGQEVTVTAMQLACAISAIANGGLYVRPWVVRKITDENGEDILAFEPKVIRRVLSEETAAKVCALLQGVIDRGTGTLARLESYTAGGKTGTAQKVEPSGVYSHSRFVGSFIGFAPRKDPRIVVAVCMDEPRPYYYGGVVAAPVFKKVAENTLRYLGVESDMQRPKPLTVVMNVQDD